MKSSITDSSTGSRQQQQQPELPPGFRFHPTDEELVVHYLKNKVASAPLPVAIIAEIDLYKFDPWELPGKACFGEEEWYFFSPRERKYPNGARPNRAATSGYWKATGTDKPVVSSSSSHGSQKVGVKKALVFYGGKPPKGIKSNWVMHEYRLIADYDHKSKPPADHSNSHLLANKKTSLRLDDWVLCRIYKKKNNPQRPLILDHESCDHHQESMNDMMLASYGQVQSTLNKLPSSVLGLKASSTSTSTYNNNASSFLENDFEAAGMVTNAANNINSFPSTTTSNLLSLRPSLPAATSNQLYWNLSEEGTDHNGGGTNCSSTSATKREHDDQHVSNFPNMLIQFPQISQAAASVLHHQSPILGGNLGDHQEVFRQSTHHDQPGINWYSHI